MLIVNIQKTDSDINHISFYGTTGECETCFSNIDVANLTEQDKGVLNDFLNQFGDNSFVEIANVPETSMTMDVILTGASVSDSMAELNYNEESAEFKTKTNNLLNLLTLNNGEGI